METSYANHILQYMARERNVTIAEVLEEFKKYQVNGRVQHFWPDENEACATLLEELIWFMF